jgi:signal transduction histidine kinase
MKSVAFGIIVVLLFILLIVLFCAIIIKLYIKKIKEHGQKEIDFQKKLTQTIIETQEHTLQNIARELHDDAGQQITIINFQLEILKIKSDYHKLLEPIGNSVQQLNETIRDLSHSLNHNYIFNNDLVSVLEKECLRINSLERLKCRFNIKNPFFYEFSHNEKIIIFRIYQEIINNVIKHAQANNFSITVSQDKSVKIDFQDDGLGFDIQKVMKNQTNGLQNIFDRAKLINWEVFIESNSRSGTKIMILKKISVFPD